MAHAIIWCRVSTTAQEFESQKKELIETAIKDGFEKQDLIIIGEAGASAIKMNDLYQKEVNQLVETIDHTDSLSTIYVWEVSRLARNEVAFYQMKDKIIKNKIQFKCNVPQIKLLDDNGEVNQGMEITLNLLVTLAKQEMDIKKKRFARGKKQKAEEGKYNGGAIPFGYRIDKGNNNLIVIDDDDSVIVKEIFDKYENGFSQPKLAKEMAETGRGRITISMINNILNNASYCGIKKKSKYASYERAYPPIITKEQFDRCRKIADENNSTLSKAKNIYFAEHLIKCPSCGAYWSASGSKASYHCPNAYKAMSIWQYENHTKEKCTNKTSCSINIIDSILWHVAIEKEACYREQDHQATIEYYNKLKKDAEIKLNNIEPRLNEVIEKRERLTTAWIDGSIRKATYEKKKSQIADEIRDINAEKVKYERDIKHFDETIKNLNEIQQSHPISIREFLDVIKGKNTVVVTKYHKEHNDLKDKIKKQATDDSERKRIIQRQIKTVEVIPNKIRFPFGIGVKDINCKEIVVHSYIPSFEQREFGAEEGVNYFFAIAQGGAGPMILDIEPDEYDEGIDPTFHNYRDGIDYYFTDITDEIFMLRYRDVPKRTKRDKELEKRRESIGERLSLSEASEKYGIAYAWLWNRVQMGVLSSKMIGGKHYIYPKELEEVIRIEEEEKNSIDNRMTILALSKKFNVSYSALMDKAKKGLFPSVFIGNKRYAYLEDVERYLNR